MDAVTFRRMYSARLAIGIAKRAKAASAHGKSFGFALRHPGKVTQHFLDWDFISRARETEVACAVLMIMNNEAIRLARWEHP